MSKGSKNTRTPNHAMRRKNHDRICWVKPIDRFAAELDKAMTELLKGLMNK